MLLSAPLQYCCADRTTKPMTLAQAMAAEKRWGGEVEKLQGREVHTPPIADFLCNSNISNRMNCNPLVAPAAAAAIVSMASSMRKRVIKRTDDIFFRKGDGAASPATKKAVGKVRASLSWEDATYTLIVDNYQAELNLQDIFKYCLEQETLEG